MNYYKQFAEMLGLELEQEFSLVTHNGEKANANTYKIKEDGLYCQSATKDYWFVTSYDMLDVLLKDDFKAVPKPWKPKKGDAYWKWATNLELAQFKRWNDASVDFACWKLGNCFKTSEEAQSKGKEIMEKLVKEYEEA